MPEVVAGRYRVVGALGEGAMGVVCRAYDEVLDREVALKELRVPHGLDRGEAVERFVTEARAAARLRHGSIVTVHDVVADGDRVLMAMELLEGSTLAQVVASSGPVAPEGVRSVGLQVAGALAEAHRCGVVHRDLKPDNVFWLPSGRAVVCDFGLARIGAGSGTRVGTVMGTPGYLAPEQVRGEVSGPAADVFAWGAVCFELLSGRAPFGDPSVEDPATLLWRVVQEEPGAVVVPEDPLLAQVVLWALTKDPAGRPRDGAALLAALTGQPAPDIIVGSQYPIGSGPAPPSFPLQGNSSYPHFGVPSTPMQTELAAEVRALGTSPRRRSRAGVWVAAGLGVVLLCLAAGVMLVLTGGDDADVEVVSDPSAVTRPSDTPPTATAAPTTTVTVPADFPETGATGMPILDGWVAVVESGFKGPGTLEELAATPVPGITVVDIDDYVNGDGTPPDYYPRAGTLAAVIGPFVSPSEADGWCAVNRPGQGCNVRQLRRR